MARRTPPFPCFNPWRMTARKQRRRGRPPTLTPVEVVWEFEADPDAEELLLQALAMLLPESQPRDVEAGTAPRRAKQLRLF